MLRVIESAVHGWIWLRGADLKGVHVIVFIKSGIRFYLSINETGGLNLGLYVSILVSTLSLVITWCVVRTMQRMRKRKSFGKRLLVVRDITSSLDLFWGIVFLVPLLRIPLLVIAGNSDFNMLIVVYMWMFYLPILSIINFTQAFSKVEVYQKGILSRNDIWQWNISELNSLKEDEKTTTYVFKLNRKIFKSDKVIILKRDKEKFDQAMYEVYQAIYK